MNMKLSTRAAIVAAIAALFSGCVKEDYSACKDNVTLRFVYTLNLADADKFAEQVTHTDLFIYDQTGNLYRTQRLETPAMSDASPQGRQAILSLPTGTYDIVAWSNLNTTDYATLSQQTFQQIQVQLKCNGGTVVSQQAELFHGITRLEVKGKRTSRLVEMIKNTNDIHVILYSEDPDLDDYSDYTVEITGCNGIYNYNNAKPATSALLTYTPLSGYEPWAENENTGVEAHMRVMRLFNGDDMTITIRNDGQVKHTGSLTAAICQRYPSCSSNTELDRRDIYYLPFLIEGDEIAIGDPGELQGEDGNGENGGGDINGEGSNGGNGGGDINGEGGNGGNGGGDINGQGGSGSGGNGGSINQGGTLNGK